MKLGTVMRKFHFKLDLKPRTLLPEVGSTNHLAIHTLIFENQFPLNPCPAEPGYALSANSVDPDQLTSPEAN